MTDRMTMNERCDALMNPAPRGLDDSDRNILADLRHEGCEAHCDECGRCDWEMVAWGRERPVPMTETDEGTFCPDCVPVPVS